MAITRWSREGNITMSRTQLDTMPYVSN